MHTDPGSTNDGNDMAVLKIFQAKKIRNKINALHKLKSGHLVLFFMFMFTITAFFSWCFILKSCFLHQKSSKICQKGLSCEEKP